MIQMTKTPLLSKFLTLDTFAADIINHIEAEELNEVILVGHSFVRVSRV